MKTTKETFCPLFPGFYGTIYEADEDSDIYQVNSERQSNGLSELEYDMFEFDYSEYRNNVAEEFCSFIEDKLNDLDFEAEIKFQSISSPREYNFSNDSINAEITFNSTKVLEYLKNTEEDFKAYISERYTSCDGFISSHSNDSNDWLNEWLNDQHKVGAILEFILTNEDISHDESWISNDILCTNYDELLTLETEQDIYEQNTELLSELTEQVERFNGRIFQSSLDQLFFEVKGKFHKVFFSEGRTYWSNKYELPSFVNHFEVDFNLR